MVHPWGVTQFKLGSVGSATSGESESGSESGSAAAASEDSASRAVLTGLIPAAAELVVVTTRLKMRREKGLWSRFRNMVFVLEAPFGRGRWGLHQISKFFRRDS